VSLQTALQDGNRDDLDCAAQALEDWAPRVNAALPALQRTMNDETDEPNDRQGERA
jgi:hypothetical protein